MWIFCEGSATKEISYTSWRNQFKSSWNHEKSKQISLKSSSEISPTLQPHPLYNVWRHFWGKSRGNQREIRKSHTPKLLVGDPSIFWNKGVTSTDLLQSNLLLIVEVSCCRCDKLGVPKYLYLVGIIPIMPQWWQTHRAIQMKPVSYYFVSIHSELVSGIVEA